MVETETIRWDENCIRFVQSVEKAGCVYGE